jgi:hypothetical protein
MQEMPIDDRDPWVDENGLLRIQFGNRPRSLADAQRTIRLAEATPAGRRMPMPIDARALTEMPPPDSRLTSIPWIPTVAGAADTLLVPAQVFGDPVEAGSWLREQSNP